MRQLGSRPQRIAGPALTDGGGEEGAGERWVMGAGQRGPANGVCMLTRPGSIRRLPEREGSHGVWDPRPSSDEPRPEVASEGAMAPVHVEGTSNLV